MRAWISRGRIWLSTSIWIWPRRVRSPRAAARRRSSAGSRKRSPPDGSSQMTDLPSSSSPMTRSARILASPVFAPPRQVKTLNRRASLTTETRRAHGVTSPDLAVCRCSAHVCYRKVHLQEQAAAHVRATGDGPVVGCGDGPDEGETQSGALGGEPFG